MRIAGTVQESIVDGPGLRFVIFAQGCPHRCPGCHNPQTHDFEGGREVSTQEIIRAMLANPLTDGVTFTGGEPFCQSGACAEVARAAKEHGLNVWAYSGWTFEELYAMEDPDVRRFLELVDVLVDGPFIQEQRSLNIKWRGSRNQRLIDVPRSLKAGAAVELPEKPR